MIVSLLRWQNDYISSLEALLDEKILTCSDKQSAMQVLPEAEIIITVGGAPLLDSEMVAVLKKPALVLSISTGVDQLPLAELSAQKIAVCSAKGAQAVSVAEYVLCCILAMRHRLPAILSNQSNKHWENYFGADIDGRTLCVIGTGRIGIEIAKRAKAFNMQVHGVKRRPAPVEPFDRVWGTDDLTDALAEADVVVVATPLTDETYHLISAAQLRVMKTSAILVNISRGPTVDETALIDALQSGQIAGAVLDVFEKEPLSTQSPLWGMDNVIVTPHNAALTEDTNRKIIQILHKNILNFRNGCALINQINPNAAY